MEGVHATNLFEQSSGVTVFTAPPRTENFEVKKDKVNTETEEISDINSNKVNLENFKNERLEKEDQLTSFLENMFTKQEEGKEAEQEDINEKARKDANTANEVLDVLNKKLRFIPDERVDKNIIVQLVDQESGKILKQYPPEDMIALLSKIEDSITGALVDNKV